MNDIIKTIYERRSVRKFKDTPLDPKTIELLLDAGRMAPSAMNKQPWRFHVLTSPALIKSISGEIATIAEDHFHLLHGIHLSQTGDAIFHRAPLVIFISAPKDNSWAQLDVGMCAQNMMLAAKSLTIDSCSVGFGKFVEKTKSFPLLKVPSTEQVILALIFGYGDEQPKSVERSKDNVVYI